LKLNESCILTIAVNLLALMRYDSKGSHSSWMAC